MSPVISTGCGVAAMNACQCASIRPGISTRPPPAMTRRRPRPSIGSGEIRSIMLPRTSTFEGADSAGSTPSKMRTSVKSVAPPPAGGAAGARPEPRCRSPVRRRGPSCRGQQRPARATPCGAGAAASDLPVASGSGGSWRFSLPTRGPLSCIREKRHHLRDVVELAGAGPRWRRSRRVNGRRGGEGQGRQSLARPPVVTGHGTPGAAIASSCWAGGRRGCRRH